MFLDPGSISGGKFIQWRIGPFHSSQPPYSSGGKSKTFTILSLLQPAIPPGQGLIAIIILLPETLRPPEYVGRRLAVTCKSDDSHHRWNRRAFSSASRAAFTSASMKFSMSAFSSSSL